MVDASFGIDPADDERVQRLLAVLKERQPALELYLSDAYRACVLVGLKQLEREHGLTADEESKKRHSRTPASD